MAIHRLVEQQAAQDGGRPAIVEGTHVLTYGQLNARPNLPVLIRPSDIAVVLGGNGAGGRIVVPHEAVLAMRDARMSAQYSWERDSQRFDVWLVLIAGGTLTIDAAVADAAA